MFIRIVSIPAGEAPLEIRKRWVGLVLPLLEGDPGAVTLEGAGILTQQPSRLRFCGVPLWRRGAAAYFRVPTEAALEVLLRVAPDAEAWWRANASWLEGQLLCFEARCAELVAADVEQYASPEA